MTVINKALDVDVDTENLGDENKILHWNLEVKNDIVCIRAFDGSINWNICSIGSDGVLDLCSNISRSTGLKLNNRGVIITKEIGRI